MATEHDNDNRVVTRTLSWRELVQKAQGKDWRELEVVYEFSGGRQFKSTDRTDSGIYGGND